jgi:hypothetical protein
MNASYAICIMAQTEPLLGSQPSEQDKDEGSYEIFSFL